MEDSSTGHGMDHARRIDFRIEKGGDLVFVPTPPTDIACECQHTIVGHTARLAYNEILMNPGPPCPTNTIYGEQ